MIVVLTGKYFCSYSRLGQTRPKQAWLHNNTALDLRARGHRVRFPVMSL